MVTFEVEEDNNSYSSSLDLPNPKTEPNPNPFDFEQFLLKGFQNVALKEENGYYKNSEEEKYYYYNNNSDITISNLEAERESNDTTKYQYPLRPYAEDCPFYLKTGNCKFGFNCKFNHPVKRPYQGVKEKKNRGGFVEQTGQIECKYYLTTGGCKYGTACRYNHSKEKSEIALQELDSFGLPIQLGDKEKENEREGFTEQTGLVECKYYLTAGGCKFGKACKYSHSEEKSYKYIEKSELEPPELNFLGLPIRVLEKDCAFYMLHGSCGFGVNCRFHHPDPTSAEGSNPYDSSPTGAYVGKYSLGNHNGYQASKYPQERTKHLHSAPPMNNLIKTADVSTFRQVQEFPERPGQPECDYFLKTGDCKFRSACKFHHPKSLASKASVCNLSNMGLPLRPGRKICQHYEKCGTCKYGTRCLFDHPENYGSSPFPIGSIPELPSGNDTAFFGGSKMAVFGMEVRL